MDLEINTLNLVVVVFCWAPGKNFHTTNSIALYNNTTRGGEIYRVVGITYREISNISPGLINIFKHNLFNLMTIGIFT